MVMFALLLTQQSRVTRRKKYVGRGVCRVAPTSSAVTSRLNVVRRRPRRRNGGSWVVAQRQRVVASTRCFSTTSFHQFACTELLISYRLLKPVFA